MQLAALALLPRTRTLHQCEHVHVLHMPNALRPYKLLSRTKVASFGTLVALRATPVMCACMRRWADGG